MPQSLRSILGGSNRVRKPSSQNRSRPTTASPSPRKAGAGASTGSPSPSPRKGRGRRGAGAGHATGIGDGQDDALFEERLDDTGAVARLLTGAEDEEALTLRDVVQAMRYVRRRMFSPVPERGLDSRRTGELRMYRETAAPVVTAGHLHAVLDSPTAVERETAELLRRGVIRRARVGRRGAMGEALIETADLEAMVRQAALPAATSESFVAFLRANPTSQTVPAATSGADHILSDQQTDELIRAGFLTSASLAGSTGTLGVRPEDRTTLTSIERVSRHASGSISAVGGQDAIHLAGGGGGGGGSMRNASASTSVGGATAGAELRVAIPGHGRHMKLSQAGADWVREALGRTRWGECPESWLKERFEGGGLYGPRWRDFAGVRWDWVLGEAVGLGMVELFETGSVGRGVRAAGV